jgi:L,D-transpeptidase YcbB
VNRSRTKAFTGTAVVARGALLVVAALLAVHRVAAAQALPERLQDRLGAEPQDALRPLLARVYEQRAYHAGWVGERGPLPVAAELLEVIGAAGTEGLDPDDYPHAAIRRLLQSGREPDSLARLELLLSRTLLAYGSDLSRGRVDPAAVDSPWTAARRGVDLAVTLKTVLDSGRPAQVLEHLAPPQPGYAKLRRALKRYREIADRGGWPAIPAGLDLVAGTRDSRVIALRTRLVVEGDLPSGDDRGDVYDTVAVQAVRRFQTRHGLEPDGVVGPATRGALNVPVRERIRQIELNLERWRWLPRSLGQRYVMVNSAAFELALIDSGGPAMTMRAVVGRVDRPTPIVSGQITSLIFSPVWHIPRSIAVEEVLPLVQRDPQHLRQHGISVFEDSSRTAHQVDPGTVNWAAMTEQTFNLQLRQAPGGDNPLGGVKFIFGSRFNVCIHDTPVRSLFHERVRVFSHGCIRIEQAADLAVRLLQDSVRWSGDSVRTRMTGPTEEVVPFPLPIPTHLTYWTVWVDDDGTIEFRDDIYGWDERLADALAQRRATSPSNPTRSP